MKRKERNRQERNIVAKRKCERVREIERKSDKYRVTVRRRKIRQIGSNRENEKKINKYRVTERTRKIDKLRETERTTKKRQIELTERTRKIDKLS